MAEKKNESKKETGRNPFPRITHTLEEVNELKAWFDAHAGELPREMQINSSAFTPDLPDTVESLFLQAYICYENYKMQGCIFLLKQIKKNLEEAGVGV